MENNQPVRLPILPRPLALPLSVLPSHFHSTLLATTLSFVFASHIRAGELDFLRQRTVCIQVQDATIEFRLTLTESGFVASSRGAGYDLKIRGTVFDFLTLISRNEDSDTLFFQRRLKMEGDTELGLYIKNFLDSMDVDSLKFYRAWDYFSKRGVWLYKHLFG